MTTTSSILVALGTGAVLYGLWAVYKMARHFYLPPAIRHFPRVSFRDFAGYMMRQTPYMEAWDTYYRDKFKTSDYVVAPGLSGWSVRACGLETVRYISTNYQRFAHVQPKDIGGENSLIARFIGINVGIVNGEAWHRHRPIINAAFTKLRPTTAAAEAGAHMVGNLKKAIGKPVDMDKFIRRAMFRSLLNAIFDLPELTQGDRDEEVSTMIKTLFDRSINGLYVLLPFLDRPWFPPRRKDFELLHEFDELVRNIIKKKIEDLDAKGPDYDASNDRDLITLMLNAMRDPENAKLTEEELLGNVKILFFGGHETTASALTFTMQMLAIHQDVQDKVREEVLRVLGSKPGEMITPDPDKQKELVYMNAVIRECNRLYPPSSQTNLRYTLEDTTFPDGTFLPKGSTVHVDQLAVLRSEKVWPDADAFKPERHLGDVKVGRNNIEYMVFGAGKRICPGMNLAILEQRVMLAQCLQMFKWELADPEDGKHIKTSPNFVLQPKNAIFNIQLLN